MRMDEYIGSKANPVVRQSGQSRFVDVNRMRPPVQLQTLGRTKGVSSAKIFLALICACCAIGVVGVYFMVLPGSPFVHSSTPSVVSHTLAKSSSTNSSALQVVAQAKLQQFKTSIDQLKRQGKNVISSQLLLEQERTKLETLRKPEDYVSFLIRVGGDLTNLQGDLANNNPQAMLANYLNAAKQWGNAHKYHDTYDGKDYYLDSSYLAMDGGNGHRYGYGSYMQDAIKAGEADSRQRIEEGYFLHSMLEANSIDATPYNQPHLVDQQLLKHFGLTQSHVLLVSLAEQAMRVYNNGKLEDATLVTTGRYNRPTPPGLFQTTAHLYNALFQSSDPPTSPDYYPPVTIQLTIQFGEDGYYLHTAQWRHDFGPFTQFPHQDSSGNTEANNGSHGCVNVPVDALARLDPTITQDTRVIIF